MAPTNTKKACNIKFQVLQSNQDKWLLPALIHALSADLQVIDTN